MPEPLERAEWQLPEPEVGTLSNGIPVRVARNSEVPLWQVRLVLGVGSYADPDGKEGLAELTFDMMDEGAGERDAAQLSRDLQRLLRDPTLPDEEQEEDSRSEAALFVIVMHRRALGWLAH